MKKIKVPFAITSLSFNKTSDLIAASSYSTDKIDIYSVNNKAKVKSIDLTGPYNPENSILWIDNTIVCIDDNSKKISFIDYDKGVILNEFKHIHARGFESIDHINYEGKDFILVSGKKIHPPTIKKLELSIDHKALSNLFMIDIKGNLVLSASIPGNIIKSKIIKYTSECIEIFVLSRNIEGTSVFSLNLDFSLRQKEKLTLESAANGFITNNLNNVFFCLKLDDKKIPVLFKSYTSNPISYEKLFNSNETYINSIYSSDTLSLIEYFMGDDNSLLMIHDNKSKTNVDKFNVYGFMECVAFGKNIIAWSENNYVSLVNT